MSNSQQGGPWDRCTACDWLNGDSHSFGATAYLAAVTGYPSDRPAHRGRLRWPRVCGSANHSDGLCLRTGHASTDRTDVYCHTGSGLIVFLNNLRSSGIEKLS